MVTFAEISPSEFFYRNRDLAGFTNPARALYMAVRELMENSLDAAELQGILPDVYVRIISSDGAAASMEPTAFRLSVADNGPGVDPHQVPRAFGKVFYGSKYVLRQSRGMFGLGGTMAILYGQITTNKPVKVTTSTDGKTRHIFDMLIEISENKPVIIKKDTEGAGGKTGTRVDLMLEGDYIRAAQKIGDYFKQTALVASYANLTLLDPEGRMTVYERATESMPSVPQETLPHPHGMDVEAFKRLIKITDEKSMEKLMGKKHFHRVGETTAKKFLAFAGINPNARPGKLTNEQIVKIVDALQHYPDFLPPDASVLSPVGEQILQAGIVKELQPEFSTVVERPPGSYSGFPFLVEVGVAYGGKVLEPGRKLLRFANRIPLLYDESSDVSFKVMNEQIDWRRYHVPDDAPLAVITHICLPAFEKVLANVDGQLRQCEIGSLVDEEIGLGSHRETKDGVTYVVPRRAITVPSVNPATFKIEYVPVKRFMKRAGSDILKITAEEGRTIHVSPEHPLLVMVANGIEVRRATDLVDGDYLIAARKLPRPTSIPVSKRLDLLDSFAKAELDNEIVVVGAKQLLYRGANSEMAQVLEVPKHQIDNWRRHDRIPLWAYLKLETDPTLRSKIRLLGRRSHGTTLPPFIEFERDFARLLGFYLSEGCSHCERNDYVSFSFHRDETLFHAEIIDILNRLFNLAPTIDRKRKDKAVQIVAYNKALALLFAKVLKMGVDSGTKRIPDFIFSTGDEFIGNLLDTYFAGDGYLYAPTRHLQACSSSDDLIQGLFLLMQIVGLSGSISRYRNYGRIDLQGGENLPAVRQILHTIIAKKGAAMESVQYKPSTAHRVPVFAFAKNGAFPSALRQHVGGRLSDTSRISEFVARRLGLVDKGSERFLTGQIQCVRLRKVEVVKYHESYYNVETGRGPLPNYMHGNGIFSHNCSTKVPYKTVGKEYIADRPEIESEIKNALRDALRRLSLYLSKKGSMEAVQRKINIYGKYLPMIAKFATELAEKKKLPNYKPLVKESEETPSGEETGAGDEQKTEGQGNPNGQAKIEEYS